jgi:hypothetical protein
MILIPTIDSLAPTLPLRLTDARWRWSVVGQFSNVMLVPLVGFLIAMAVAHYTSAPRIKRVLGIICALVALVIAIMSVFFLMDYFKVRPLANPNAQHAMGVASSVAFIKNVLSIIVLGLLARAGFVRSVVVPVAAGPRATEPSPTLSSSPLVGVGRVRPARTE